MQVPFSYLDRQFADTEVYLADIGDLVRTGDFTLGAAVEEFERRFAKMCGLPYAVGVGSGTDAIILSLELLGIGPGDEVVTTANTFIATVGAIAAVGAKPVFVDSEDGFVIDPEKVEAAITPRTRALLPVHYTGNVADMPRIAEIAASKGLPIVEDACQAIAASIGAQPVGSWGETACFSLHPLKNLNVWGDGGVIVTRSAEHAERLRLIRNHGLVGRDEVQIFGRNSRLDSLHAVIGNRLIEQVDHITQRRIDIAGRYDEAFADLDGRVAVPVRRPGVRHVYHLYVVRSTRRDELLAFLQQRGVEAKVHYPIPVHLQPAFAHLGAPGSFPEAEKGAEEILSLPMFPELEDAMIEQVCDAVRGVF